MLKHYYPPATLYKLTFFVKANRYKYFIYEKNFRYIYLRRMGVHKHPLLHPSIKNYILRTTTRNHLYLHSKPLPFLFSRASNDRNLTKFSNFCQTRSIATNFIWHKLMPFSILIIHSNKRRIIQLFKE